MNTPNIKTINLKKKSRCLAISYDNDLTYELSFEFLRVHSPSAEVQGHHPDQAVLQSEKAEVAIIGIETVGNYAVKLIFDDGHDSGIFSWSYLYELGSKHEQYWQEYLEKLKAAGKSRFANTQVLFFEPKT